MRRSIRLAAATAALLLVIPMATVQATPSLAVHFDVPTTFGPGGTGPTFGPFTATGPAVDEGVICESGATIDVFSKASAFRSPVFMGINFQVVKEFTCEDGSGTFFVKLQVRIDGKGDNFAWVIVGGTGDYARLRGVGSGVGFPTDTGVFDVYDGWVHLD